MVKRSSGGKFNFRFSKHVEKEHVQSAMEYLMTYSWSILVIAVVLGALFALGTFGTGTYTPTACIASIGYLCQNPILNATGNLSITFGKEGAYPITITGIGCTNSPSAPQSVVQENPGITLQPGKTTTLSFSCPISSNIIGATFKGQLWIVYNNNKGSGFYADVAKITAVSTTKSSVGASTPVVHYQLLATIPVGTEPVSLAFNPSGTLAYVVNYGSNDTNVIDVATSTVVESIPGNKYTYHVAFNPSGTLAYVVNIGDNTANTIDVSTSTVINTMIVGPEPASVAINPTMPLAYVAIGANPSLVDVIDTSTNTIIKTITVGLDPADVVFNPSGTLAYTANYEDNTVSVIDVASNTVVATVSVGLNPGSLAVNPQGTLVYVANIGSNTVSVIDIANNEVVATITVGPAGSAPDGVAFNPSGTLAYVANSNVNTVSVVDTSTDAVVGTIPVGGGPSAIAINPSGVLYTTNWNDNTVTAIQLS